MREIPYIIMMTIKSKSAYYKERLRAGGGKIATFYLNTGQIKYDDKKVAQIEGLLFGGQTYSGSLNTTSRNGDGLYLNECRSLLIRILRQHY